MLGAIAIKGCAREVGAMKRFVLLLCLPLLLISTTASGRTWYITPDGAGDAPAIEAGIDSATTADTVLVACGTYYEHGIRMKSGIILVSETGEADCVVIDAQWNNIVFLCYECDSTTLIKGFTFTHGTPSVSVPPGYGGGMVCLSSSLRIVNCTLVLGSFAVSPLSRSSAVHSSETPPTSKAPFTAICLRPRSPTALSTATPPNTVEVGYTALTHHRPPSKTP